MFQTRSINGEGYGSDRPGQSTKIFDDGNHSGGGLSDLSGVLPEAIIASSRDLGWQNIRVLYMRQSCREMEIPALVNHSLILSLGPLEARSCACVRIDGYDWERRMSSGEIAIIPAGMPSRWRWNNGRQRESLHIYLEPEFVWKTAAACELDHGALALEPQLGVRDEQLSYLAMSLLYEMKEENIVGRIYADSVAFVVAMQLIRRYSCLRDVRISRGGMAPQKLRRAIGYISDHIDHEQEISLAVVAEEVGMSYYHFSRAFKQAMGLSPINYITHQRMERAKRLLTETELSIAEIALRAGFSSQSHFTTSFRRLAGVTPRTFRRGM
ncbi:MAG: helix-turn-helix transcriptional regulator [Blastocatellia bacterium]|nr:helix-turn-helix transcriptional regulator [Blastocatellia bacterium]